MKTATVLKTSLLAYTFHDMIKYQPSEVIYSFEIHFLFTSSITSIYLIFD